MYYLYYNMTPFMFKPAVPVARLGAIFDSRRCRRGVPAIDRGTRKTVRGAADLARSKQTENRLCVHGRLMWV